MYTQLKKQVQNHCSEMCAYREELMSRYEQMTPHDVEIALCANGLTHYLDDLVVNIREHFAHCQVCQKASREKASGEPRKLASQRRTSAYPDGHSISS
jgi:hypothetical protein